MHFDGLIAKLRGLHCAEHIENFKLLQTTMLEVVHKRLNNHRTSVKAFGSSHLVLFDREPPFSKNDNLISLTSKQQLVLDTFTEQLHARLGNHYRTVFRQMVWLCPGEHVEAHIDIQAAFMFTRRFNLMLTTDGLSYYVYNKDTQVEIEVKDGDLFELNNRSLHSVQNHGNKVCAVLVVDVLEQTAPCITEAQRVDKANIMVKQTAQSPPIIWIDQ
jgi:hypothetical protein